MTRRVVLLTADRDTHRRVEAALAGRRVEVVDPTCREVREEGVVGDVAVVDTETCDGSPTDFEADRVVKLTANGCEPSALRVEKPVESDALCEAVDRAFKRLTYVEGLDAFTAAATGHHRGAPDAGQASLGESLGELVEGFDHADFTAAFRDAVAGH